MPIRIPRIPTRRKLWRAVALVAVIVSTALLLRPSVVLTAQPEWTRPAQWRLTWHADPATSAVFSWSTAEPGSVHRVHLRQLPDGSPQTIDCQRNGQYTADKGVPDLYYHHGRLLGLQPNTRYEVACESDSQRSPTFHFITAPNSDQPLSIIFGGDSRSGRAPRRQMNVRIATLVEEQPAILALAHGGDYVARGQSLPEWSEWLSDHELTTTRDGRLLPIVPTRGNHDTGALLNEIFDFPDGDKNYYAVSLSPQVRLVTLNTEASTAGDQARWLETELAASRPKSRWLVAQYHRPAYPAVKKAPSGARQHWVPLFEKYNVDLVCEADGHVIKRTLPIRDEKHDPTGVVYIGEGGLGVEQRTPDAKRWYVHPPGMASKGHHLHLLTFRGDQLHCQAILLGGEMVDDYILAARHIGN